MKVNNKSPFQILRKNEDYVLYCNEEPIEKIVFQKKPDWYSRKIEDGTPIPRLGLSQHGDMLIVNASPGCEYFLHQDESSGNYRCRFCFYGAPNPKMPTLGQPETLIKEEDLLRLAEAVSIASKEINHIYLVAGSMADINQEAERYIQVASSISRAVDDRVNICCGSSALPKEASCELKKYGVGAVCFNLEIWDEELWDKICPGKSKFVGRENWIQGLTDAVDVFGRGNVMSAFVSGIEIMQPYAYSTQQALKSSLDGAEFLLQKGVISLFTLYWPRDASEFEEKSDTIRDYFLELSNEYHKLRKQYDLNIPNKFVCQDCSYMQLDCDFDCFM
ncbi:MAG: biotin synthase [Candidatus Scalindua brodae]|uniref:Biotin synthase n=1 Tax=Candidatus Scalindua brodae TaxID=237368 RepID=A0A0B0ELR9_9BACT|nr:MAG: biotin synthase [Candidatus Scalindua brodae]